MTQATLEFDGSTYDEALDGERLGRQLDRVRDVLLANRGTLFTLSELQRVAGGSEAGVSARIRDLRKQRNGGHKVLRRRRSTGTWEYGIPREANKR